MLFFEFFIKLTFLRYVQKVPFHSCCIYIVNTSNHLCKY